MVISAECNIQVVVLGQHVRSASFVQIDTHRWSLSDTSPPILSSSDAIVSVGSRYRVASHGVVSMTNQRGARCLQFGPSRYPDHGVEFPGAKEVP